MRSNMTKNVLKLIAIAGVLSSAGFSSAADVYLRAESFDKDIPNNDGMGGTIPVRMWGFAECDAGFTACDLVSSPGPQIEIDLATDTSLTIHVKNTLNDPVSIMIPGLGGDGDPVTFTDGLGRQRVRSLTHETGPGATESYTWALRPGTFLYHSGTAAQLQVPMGLYGAVVVRDGDDAYPGVSPDSEALLLMSEIDPIQNGRVDAAAAGGPTQACVPIAEFVDDGAPGYPCTIDYYPVITLVNGAPTTDLGSGIAAGDLVLLRMLNAGQRTHVPAIINVEMDLIAEDSFRYPGTPRRQAQASLAAGKTLDALMQTDSSVADVTLSIFDRQPTFNNETIPNGGAIGGIVVGMGTQVPTPPTTYAVDDVYAVTEDATPFSSGTTVLNNDVGLAGSPIVTVVTDVSSGSLTLNSDGSFQYTPDEDFSGTDTFAYAAEDGTGSYPATVTLNVSFENDAPTANDDGPYVNTVGTTITVDAASGVLGNDVDPDGDALTAVLDAPVTGLTLEADGSFVYTGAAATTFSYHANDGTSDSASATVTIESNPVANIALDVNVTGGGDVNNYRWIVQEDRTFDHNPDSPGDPLDGLSLNFHRSYMPVVAQGCVGTGCTSGNSAVPIAPFNDAALDPNKRYYVSVLPNDAGSGAGHTMGGAQIAAGTSGGTIEVLVNSQPMPTAKISVFAFEDNSPTNGVPDPGEQGLGGFQILIEDAAGTFGQGPGFVQQDVFGDPLTNALASNPDCFDGMASPPAAGIAVIVTCADGTALIENLPPGKYGIVTVPRQTGPEGASETWSQTSTIEGSKVVDVWVKAGEPPYWVEFGAPGFHVFHGYVNPDNTTVPPGTPPGQLDNSVVGAITPAHVSRAPSLAVFDASNYNSLAHTRPWVGLNSVAGDGPNIATVRADLVEVGGNLEAQFRMDGIPDGTYQLVVWDDYLDQIISFQTVILSGGGETDVGNVVVPTWFGRHEHSVFLDENENGVWDDGEAPLPEQNITLRFRSGGVYQSFPTDLDGFVPFDTVFPFANWLVAEVDFARHKATGVTVTVDGGGDNSGGPYPGLLNPQDASPRTETGVVLTEGFHSMAGMTSLFEWGKKPYEPGENGGISGIVFYGSTRGENDPRLTVGDTWEPGIPGVTVRLWKEIEAEDGGTQLRLVDEVQTDSWDDNLPDGCPGEAGPSDPFVSGPLNGEETRCYDSIRNFEQVRPGALFDGGYAFDGIKPGAYVVEVVPPPGYEIIKEEDKNVDFGDSFEMAPVPMMAAAAMVTLPDAAMVAEVLGAEQWGLTAPECVGPDHTVPDTLSLFPGEVDTWAPYAGAVRPLCTHKRVILHDQANAAADFHLFTATPVAGQYTGLATDDIAIATDRATPNYGDKWSPAFMPVTQRDYEGNIVYRGYTDRFGKYNGMVPSTYSANLPIPSGYSPAMHSICLNDPTMPDGSLDTKKLPQYGTFCYTLMYMPGLTTYLDTPMLPSAAFAAGYNPADCSLPDGYPVVSQVDGTGVGPLVESTGSLKIYSQGMTSVPNPEYEGPLAASPYDQSNVMRNFGFGDTAGTVMLGDTELTDVTWGDDMITANVNGLVADGEYQLVVTNAAGQSSINTVTVTVGSETPTRVTEGEGAIQAAIDAASPGELIIVEPGIYNELVVMWKPVRLQGSGASTIISAVKFRPEVLESWLNNVLLRVGNGDVDLLPNQPDDLDQVGPGLLTQEPGSGITVLAKNDGSFSGNPSRIDGFTVTGAEGGGGIFVNGYAHDLVISNNNVTGNSGLMHGGIRFGHPDLGNLPAGSVGTSTFGYNQNVQVHHNSITFNGAQGEQAIAGGVAMCTGTDGYRINDNYICGNFNRSDGGGIGHYGLSDDGVIAYNQVLFNQNFNQGQGANGAGIHIAGEIPVNTTLTLGSGDVDIDANQIQGNQAGSGHGGGIRTQLINGEDAAASNQPDNWWAIDITNNMIVNNMAGWSGAGISMQDTANATIVLNTIANNDSTGTVGAVLGAGPQPAGISSEAHSLGLNEAIPGGLNSRRNFSSPELTHNIIWQNRAFTFAETGGATNGPHLEPELAPASPGDCAAGAQYVDLGVLDPAFSLSPARNILTSTTGYPGNNLAADPEFLNAYCNTSRTMSTVGPMEVAFEPGEGGNAIEVRFGPLSTTAYWDDNAPWDYHITANSPAIDRPGNAPSGANVDHDFDDESRPNGSRIDVGADEYYPVGMPPVEPPAPGSIAYSSGDFGVVPIGSTAELTIAATVSGSDVTFAGSSDPAAPFGKTADNCDGETVTDGNSCSFTVTYTATEPPGPVLGSFTVSNDGDGSPQTVSLLGRGVEASEVEIAAATLGDLGGGILDFGNLPNNPDVTSTVTLTVNGGADVTFGTLSLSGNANYSLGADTCSNSIQTPPTTCSFDVVFDPQGGNLKNATVAIPHDSVGDMSLSLTGR